MRVRLPPRARRVAKLPSSSGRTAGFQPANESSILSGSFFGRLRSACSAAWLAHVPRAHGVEGSNPSTLTASKMRAGGRAAMHQAVTLAAPVANGGSNPSLRILFSRAGSPNGGAPASKSGSDRFDPCPACLRSREEEDVTFHVSRLHVSRADHVAERSGSGLQSPRRRFDSCRDLCLS